MIITVVYQVYVSVLIIDESLLTSGRIFVETHEYSCFNLHTRNAVVPNSWLKTKISITRLPNIALIASHSICCEHYFKTRQFCRWQQHSTCNVFNSRFKGQRSHCLHSNICHCSTEIISCHDVAQYSVSL